MPLPGEVFAKFEADNGGRASRINAADDWWLYPTGAEASIPGGHIASGVWGLPNDPVRQAENVARYHAARLGEAVGRFDDLRAEYARAGFGDLDALRSLAAEVDRRRAVADVAQEAAEFARTGLTKEQREEQAAEIAEADALRESRRLEFLNELQSIEV